MSKGTTGLLMIICKYGYISDAIFEKWDGDQSHIRLFINETLIVDPTLSRIKTLRQ